MVPERTQPLSRRHDGYLHNRLFTGQHRRVFKQPINAVTCDSVDLSDNEPNVVGEYKWLTTMVSTMSEKEVARRMKKHRDSYSTIDDAVADKVIMEAL